MQKEYIMEDIKQEVEKLRQDLIKAVTEVFEEAQKREDRVELEDILKLFEWPENHK
jgi:hypothetical protein